MRDGMRRSAGLALLLGILCAPPARAQDQPDQTPSPPAARPWSDPPTKPVDLPGAAEPATRSSAGPAPAETRRPASASARPARPATRTAARAARATPRARHAERRTIVRREAETRVAARPRRRSVVEAPPSWSTAARPPAYRAPPTRVARPLPPEMRGSDVDLWVDARADRIRRAQDGGFLVMRRTTVEDPMGRRMQILRPFDDEDE
ncbi:MULTISPECIES: hypothetical protein [Methylobacterium]|uniref:hypothetical protein n=1 Tax=Methylobacterium TaxID=407 RepID=UPI0013ECC11F|nr:hypothetical protein [Methylobacterium sp. DB0501]NGM33155.1 hypothetical protein [Methylobacterium sp. DB0501]